MSFKTQDYQDYSRFVLSTSNPIDYTLLTLKSPPRIVIDIKDITDTNGTFLKKKAPHKRTSRIKGTRYAKKTATESRLVLDLNQPMAIKKYFTLPPSGNHKNHRFVIDIQPSNESLDLFVTTTPIPTPVTKNTTIPSDSSIPQPLIKPKPNYKPLIVIDAGHGGRDPGSIGRRKKTQEKHITLTYALDLKKSLIARGKYRVYMTRTVDQYIGLKQRVQKSEAAKGDLFISIHADSHKNRKIRGLSVYTLSEKASDKEAASLAYQANKSHTIGHVTVKNTNREVNALLVDMIQRNTKNLSSEFAERLVKELKREVRLLRNTHRFAGFRVLTSATIPSVLIELGYLSNRQEETLLRSKNYKKKLVSSIVKAIDSHFKTYKIQK